MQLAPFVWSDWHTVPLHHADALQLVEHTPEHVVLQAPVELQTYCPHAFSTSVPAARLVHVPTEPARLQAWQPLVHDVLQHTPSTQFPDAHSQVLVQVLPSAFVATHAPVVVQKLPLLQKLLQKGCAEQLP